MEQIDAEYQSPGQPEQDSLTPLGHVNAVSGKPTGPITSHTYIPVHGTLHTCGGLEKAKTKAS